MHEINKLRKKEKFKEIQQVIKDAKKFNQKITNQIRKTNRFLQSSHPEVNRGTIRVMLEQEKKIQHQIVIKNNEIKYQKAKQQYTSDLHDLMEKIISIKKKYPY